MEDDFQAYLLMTCIPSLEKDLYFQNHDSYVSHGQTVAQRLPINMSFNGFWPLGQTLSRRTLYSRICFVYAVDIPTPFFSCKHLWSLATAVCDVEPHKGPFEIGNLLSFSLLYVEHNLQS